MIASTVAAHVAGSTSAALRMRMRTHTHTHTAMYTLCMYGSHKQALEKALERADAALDENQDRVGIMTEHLKNVQQELKYTQTRVGVVGRKAAQAWKHGPCHWECAN